MTDPVPKLPARADEILADFYLLEPDFEAQARAIEARIDRSVRGTVSEHLLKAPELAAEPGEPTLSASSHATSVPRSSFTEMARRVVQQQDADAGRRELLEATAQSRRPNAQMVERVRAAGRSAATPIAAPARDASEQRTSEVAARAEMAPAPLAPPAGMRRWTRLGIVGSVVAMAACVALFLKVGQRTPALEATRTESFAASQPSVASQPVAAPKSGSQRPEGLPTEPDASRAAIASTSASTEARAQSGAPTPRTGPTKLAPSKSKGAAQEPIALEEDIKPAPAVNSEKPRPDAEVELTPAEGNDLQVPLNPSGGAVSTALSAVRGNAQACLAGQSDAVTAVVTFGSKGGVLSVSAAGPSGPCIQAALAKAHIAPFAKERFSATTTIRPP